MLKIFYFYVSVEHLLLILTMPFGFDNLIFQVDNCVEFQTL